MSEVDNKSEIDSVYQALSKRADELYDFVIQYNEYINEPRDYGTGEMISMVEVHTLTMIEDNPGITVTEIAKRWGKTPGAASQNVSKLVKKGLVYRKKTKDNAKTVHLYPTELGIKLSTAHKLYDTLDITQTTQSLLKECTTEEIDTFYKVIRVYTNLFNT